MDEKLYLRFEHLHRGDKENLKARFQVYEPIISLICREVRKPKFLDLGCGDGGFLSYLSSFGGHVIGVEKNPANLCKQNEKIILEHGDALAWVKQQEDSSFDFVSGLHVVEHLEFSYLYELVGEIKRVLKKDGILLFETPNPDNLTVATNNFYTDPTHLRLVPANLLRFVIKDHGFSTCHFWGVNESSHISESPSLHDVLGGASPDYAIIASVIRTGFAGEMEKILEQPRGRSTEQICNLFEKRYQNDYLMTVEEFKKINVKIFEQNCYFRDQIFESNKEIVRLRHTFETELSTIHKSYSWRLTAPLRILARLLRRLKQIIFNGVVSFKNNSTREFFRIYFQKSRRYFEDTLGVTEEQDSHYASSVKGAFFEKYKRMLGKALRKKK